MMFGRLFGKTFAGQVGLSLLATSLASTAFAGEYIVKFKSEREMNYSLNRAKSLFSTQATETHRRGRLAKIFLKGKSDRDEAKQLVELMNRPDVEYVVENFELKALGTFDDDPETPDESPNTPDTDTPETPDESPETPETDTPETPVDETKKQWALEKVRAPDAWASIDGARDIVVAVIDTGVDTKHEDLESQIWVNANEIEGNGIDDDGNGFIDDMHGWDFFGSDNDPDDETSARNKGHGTHCAGIIGAVKDNNKGVAGIAQKVKIMPLRFLGPSGSGDLMNAIKAIDYAIAMKVDVISASWGAKVPESRATPLVEAIQRAEAAGILFVAAAANNGASNDTDSMFPANAPTTNIISVAASNVNDQKPRWSNYGEGRVHLAAPGENILSTIPGNKYDSLSGTSMATPLVAGMAALLLSETSEDAKLTPSEVRSIMQSTGTKVQIETACNCRIDAKGALEKLDSEELTVVPYTATIGIKKTQQFSTWGKSDGAVNYKVTDANVAQIDANGLLVGLKKGRTQVVATDSTGRVAQSLDIRVGLSGAPRLCPMSPVKCFFICLVSWKKPWCFWNRSKVQQSSVYSADALLDYR